MTTPELTALKQELALVAEKHADATTEVALTQAYWEVAARDGDDAEADRLETSLEKERRLAHRLELRRESLEQQIANAEAVEQGIRAEGLKETADSILARAGKRIADMEPVAAALAKLTDELEGDFNDWKEARYFAKQAGATPEGFATQANDALVRRVVDSIALSKIRTANLATEISRVSVFM